MHFITSLVMAAATAITAVSAVNHTVIVGKGALNTYEPNQLTGVQNGDFVTFKFVTKNHTVTQSTFTDPCTAKAGGVNSGFIFGDESAGIAPQWTIQIDNASAPLWFYCDRAPHCKLGMVFAINPTAEKSFAAFQATAQGTTTTGTNTTTTGTTGGATTGTTGSGTTAVGTNGTEDSSTTANSNTPPGSGALGLSPRSAGSLLAALGAVVALAL